MGRWRDRGRGPEGPEWGTGGAGVGRWKCPGVGLINKNHNSRSR